MAKQYFKLENKVDNLLLDHPSDQKIKELISLFTKEQVLYSYFFKRIDNIDWFQFLKKADLFNIKYVPKNIKTEEVIQLPIWSLLIYLEKISKKTKEEINIIDDILEIITNLSEKRKKNESFDNYRNWYHIIRILCNLPNNKISIKILKYINIWLDSKFDSLLLVSSLLKELLPKFINKKSTKADIKKAESIFLQILEPKQTVYKSLNKFGHSPKIKLNLLESFLDKELFVLFAEKCSSQFVLKLSDYLENIIIYECFNSSLPFNINSDKYVIAFELNFQKKLTLIIKDSNQKEKLKLIIDDFTNYDKKSLLTYFNRQLQSVNNNSSKKFEDIINQKIDNFLNYYTGIKRLKETELTDAHTFIQTIIILIKDILKTKLIKDTKVIDVVSLKYSGNDYYCPIFKRIVILFASYDW